MRDRTARIGRALRGHLHPGEAVLAAVAVALPGTNAARIAGAAQAAGGAAGYRDDSGLGRSRREAAALGIESGFQFFLVVTSRRVLLARRSAFGRAREVVLAAPVGEAGVRVSKPAQALDLVLPAGRLLRLETPRPFRHLPPVYERLPEIVAEARASLPAGPGRP